MKEIKAYIRRDRLDETVNALAHIEGLGGVSVSTTTGFGRSRGILRFVDFETHFKIETVCRDELKDSVVQAIMQAAKSGQRADGKIFVSEVVEAYRVQTGEQLTRNP